MADFNLDQGDVQDPNATVFDAQTAGVPSKGAHDEPPAFQGLAATIAGPAVGNNDKYKMR